MDQILAGHPFAYCYLDDLWITSLDLKTYQLHFCLVFKRLRQFGVVISLEKYVFAGATFKSLGHQVSTQGAKPLTRRPPPTTVKELQVLLGLIYFYRWFLPGVNVTCSRLLSSQGEQGSLSEAHLDS